MAGLVDMLSAEDRVQVKFSDFYNLIHQAAKEKLLENAVRCGVPHKYIREMLVGKNDLLEEYKGTGMVPEQIMEMDRLYAELCKQAADLKRENKRLHDTITKATSAAAGLEDATQENTEGGSDEKL